VLIAAVLHDTIEDTTATESEIREYFGENVLSLVREVSDDKSLPKPERKRLQILNAPHKSTAAKQIKLADKIHNIRDITLTPPVDWSEQRQLEYLDWAEAVVAGLRGANQALEDEFDAGMTVARARFANDRNS
jgi:(p)ppGpp synthase/HD superfamily hydrolase